MPPAASVNLWHAFRQTKLFVPGRDSVNLLLSDAPGPSIRAMNMRCNPPEPQHITLASPFGPLPARRYGDGPPLILLHGGAGSWNHWVRNIGALAARFTVYAPDLPGCGESPDVRRDMSAAEYIERVSESLAALAAKIGPLNLAGFSFGAVTAAGVTARLGSRIARLALLGPGGFGAQNGRVPDLRRVPFGDGSETEIRDALRHNLLVMMLADPRQADERTIELHRGNVLRARFDSRRLSLSDVMIAALPVIRCPLLLLLGEKDALACPSLEARVRMCRGLNPDIAVRVVPGAGHWVQYEAPEAVNRALLEFLAGGAVASRMAAERDGKPSREQRPDRKAD